jgi:hypothetical protein
MLDRIAEVLQVDFHDYLRERRPYLTCEQVRKLIDDGFAVGAHSIDHPKYSTVSIEEQRFQTSESLRIIRETFKLDYGAFAFPDNDKNLSRDFFNEMHSNGHMHMSFGTQGMIKDTYRNSIQRVKMELQSRTARQILAEQCVHKLIRVIKGRNRMERL